MRLRTISEERKQNIMTAAAGDMSLAVAVYIREE